MTLKSYIISRVLLFIPTLIFIIALIFVIIHLAPGSPLDYIFGRSQFTVAEYQAIKHQLGLDQPLYIQFLYFLERIFTGNLGYSYVRGQSVVQAILESAPNTLMLMGTATILSIIMGVFLGGFAARTKSKLSSSIVVFSQIGYSLPVQWYALLLIIIFALWLRWLPAVGMTGSLPLTGLPYVVDVLTHMILPVTLLATWYMAQYVLFTRSSMIEVLSQEYILAARAKGLSERRINFTHALRNALLPVITLIGLQAGYLFTGAIVVETIFAWPGIGRLLYASMQFRDYPVLLGIFFIIAVAVLLGNLLADIVYALVDPRIRYGGERKLG